MDFTEIQLFFISGTKRGFFFYFCVKAVFQMQKNPLPDLSGQDGEAEAFAQVYREFAPKMRCFASKLLHDNLLTDDVVHNVFLRLWENREIMSKVESLDRYLFRAARNAIFDIYEHQKIVTKHEQNNAPGGGKCSDVQHGRTDQRREPGHADRTGDRPDASPAAADFPHEPLPGLFERRDRQPAQPEHQHCEQSHRTGHPGTPAGTERPALSCSFIN